MIRCPTCNESADYKVRRGESDTFPEGPSIKICHGRDGAYVHVTGGPHQ